MKNDELFDNIHRFLAGSRAEDYDGLLSNDEYDRIILSFLTVRGTEVPFDDVMTVIRKCEEAYLTWTTLQMVFKNVCDVDLVDGELAFKITPEGKELWEATS